MGNILPILILPSFVDKILVKHSALMSGQSVCEPPQPSEVDGRDRQVSRRMSRRIVRLRLFLIWVTFVLHPDVQVMAENSKGRQGAALSPTKACSL